MALELPPPALLPAWGRSPAPSLYNKGILEHSPVSRPLLAARSASGKGYSKGGVSPWLMLPYLRGWTTTPGVQRAGRGCAAPPLPPSSAGAGAEGSGAERVPRLVSGDGMRTGQGDTRGEPSDRLGREPVHPLRARAARHRPRALLLRAGGAPGPSGAAGLSSHPRGSACSRGSWLPEYGGSAWRRRTPFSILPQGGGEARTPCSIPGRGGTSAHAEPPASPSTPLPPGHSAALPPLPRKSLQRIHSTSTEFK